MKALSPEFLQRVCMRARKTCVLLYTAKGYEPSTENSKERAGKNTNRKKKNNGYRSAWELLKERLHEEATRQTEKYTKPLTVWVSMKTRGWNASRGLQEDEDWNRCACGRMNALFSDYIGYVLLYVLGYLFFFFSLSFQQLFAFF